jgi:hypothetical protein
LKLLLMEIRSEGHAWLNWQPNQKQITSIIRTTEAQGSTSAKAHSTERNVGFELKAAQRGWVGGRVWVGRVGVEGSSSVSAQGS